MNSFPQETSQYLTPPFSSVALSSITSIPQPPGRLNAGVSFGAPMESSISGYWSIWNKGRTTTTLEVSVDVRSVVVRNLSKKLRRRLVSGYKLNQNMVKLYHVICRCTFFFYKNNIAIALVQMRHFFNTPRNTNGQESHTGRKDLARTSFQITWAMLWVWFLNVGCHCQPKCWATAITWDKLKVDLSWLSRLSSDFVAGQATNFWKSKSSVQKFPQNRPSIEGDSILILGISNQLSQNKIWCMLDVMPQFLEWQHLYEKDHRFFWDLVLEFWHGPKS